MQHINTWVDQYIYKNSQKSAAFQSTIARRGPAKSYMTDTNTQNPTMPEENPKKTSTSNPAIIPAGSPSTSNPTPATSTTTK